ncbi:MAG TPA: hypothetical protein VID47_00185 [Actinomycetota bacterium]|jgi:hypothetical protein
MLGSINPLGERARGSRWGVTAGWFAVASLLAGAGFGLILGAAGGLVLGSVHPSARLATFAVVVLAGTALDLGVGGLRLPSIRRQVNEDWLGRYRGWVVGAGFGAQLGVGVATIVTTSAVYGTLAGALLVASPAAGLAMGAAFGAARAVSMLGAAGADDPAAVAALDARFRRWEGPARTAAVAAQVTLAAGAVAIAVGSL